MGKNIQTRKPREMKDLTKLQKIKKELKSKQMLDAQELRNYLLEIIQHMEKLEEKLDDNLKIKQID